MTSGHKAKNSRDFISLWQSPNLDEKPAEEEAVNDEPENPEAIRQAAYDEGYERGHQEAFERRSKEVRKKLGVLDDLVASLQHPFHDLNEEIGEDIAMLAVKMAKSLVRRELRTEPETIMALVRDTVRALNTTSREINIHLNPEDARIIREIAHLSDHEQCWRALEDPLIPRGDCKVTSQDSLIDGNLEARINQMMIQFLGDDRQENRAEPSE